MPAERRGRPQGKYHLRPGDAQQSRDIVHDLGSIAAPQDGLAADAPFAVESKAAARLCGVSRAHWMKLVGTGRAPQGLRLGRRRVWSVRELRAWLDAGAPSVERWTAMRKEGQR